MNVEVLISCMHQSAKELIKRSNIQSDVLVINQCDENSEDCFEFLNHENKACTARVINTTERGLSKSRNLAIKNATGDICLLCDDDEILESDYTDKIITAFKNLNQDIIAFKLFHPHKLLPNLQKKITIFNVGKLSSWQIAFKRKSILDSSILFCEKMGSGTGNGAGEENKFICDCIKHRLSAIYTPVNIGEIIPGDSQWFNGYNRDYWVNRGWSYKMIHGKFLGYLFVLFAVIRSYKIDNDNGFLKIYYWLSKGFITNR